MTKMAMVVVIMMMMFENGTKFKIRYSPVPILLQPQLHRNLSAFSVFCLIGVIVTIGIGNMMTAVMMIMMFMRIKTMMDVMLIILVMIIMIMMIMTMMIFTILMIMLAWRAAHLLARHLPACE